MNGMTVLRVWKGAAYLRIPIERSRIILGGCHCTFCTAHPELPPRWDTLGIPLKAGDYSWELHAPEWKPGDDLPPG